MMKNILEIFNFKNIVLILCYGNFYQITSMEEKKIMLQFADYEELKNNVPSSLLSFEFDFLGGEMSVKNFEYLINHFEEIKEKFYIIGDQPTENTAYSIMCIKHHVMGLSVSAAAGNKTPILGFENFAPKIEQYISEINSLNVEEKQEKSYSITGPKDKEE